MDSFSKLTYSSVLNASGPVPPETFASQWEDLVRVYSTLKLTRQDDKLHAISGLAAAFQVHAENDEYVAGLWRNALFGSWPGPSQTRNRNIFTASGKRGFIKTTQSAE